MDIQKLFADIAENSRHWHLALFTGFIGSIKFFPKRYKDKINGGLGEVTGDNVLPEDILNSLISRRSL